MVVNSESVARVRDKRENVFGPRLCQPHGNAGILARIRKISNGLNAENEVRNLFAECRVLINYWNSFQNNCFIPWSEHEETLCYSMVPTITAVSVHRPTS